MKRGVFIIVAGLLVSLTALYAFQMPFRTLISQEGYNNEPLPPDYLDHNEFVIGRLMFPSGGGFSRFGGSWERGGTQWSNDYPRGDRAFSRILRRLTRLDVRSVEQPINLNDGDDVYNWPWLYAAHLESSTLTDPMVLRMREYLTRGGFFYVDDFWGDQGWSTVMALIQRIFPGAQAEDIADSDPVFHVLYDLHDRFMVANHNELASRGIPYHTMPGGQEAHWRGVRDEKGRIVIVLNHNSDIGDSWEWADRAEYPEKYSNLGMRLSTNYAAYAMTH